MTNERNTIRSIKTQELLSDMRSVLRSTVPSDYASPEVHASRAAAMQARLIAYTVDGSELEPQEHRELVTGIIEELVLMYVMAHEPDGGWDL